MSQIIPVCKREFLGYFRTPVAYVFLVVFLLASVGLAFFVGHFFATELASLERYFVYFPWLFLCLIPAVGMRLWSEEKRSGTIELLFTLPVTTLEAVIGKFLAAWVFLTLAILLSFPMALTIGYLGSPDWGVVATSYFGSILMAGSYLGICCFTSSLTKNQVVSFVLSVIICVVLLFLGWSVFSPILGAFLPVRLVDILANFSFITHFNAFLRGEIEPKDLMFFASLIGFTLFLNVVALEHVRQKARSIALLFVGLVLLNYLAAGVPVRWDATADHIYTLSGGTKAILARIDEPIAIDFYFSQSATGLPVEYKNYAERVREMLRQYVRASRGKITVRAVDPEPDTPEEARATAAGIAMQRPQVGGAPFYFGVVAMQAEKQKALPALSPDQEQVLEYDLSELVYGVQQHHKKRLGLITSLPLGGARGNPLTGQEAQDPQYVIREWEQTFTLVPIDASATALPARLDVLAIVHPENLSPKLQFAIDQYLLSGKPVFLAVDPASQFFERQDQGLALDFGDVQPNVSSDLPRLLGAWGIAYNPRKIVGDNSRAAQVTGQNGALVGEPVWLNLTREDFNATAPPTAKLNHLLFVDSGSLALKPGSALTFNPLVQTSANAGELDPLAVEYTQMDNLAHLVVSSGKKTIAALVTGNFPTAFPMGAPRDKGAPAGGPALAESSGRSSLLVVADTDWLFDEYSLRRYSLMGTVGVQLLDDNLAFAGNALDFLCGSQELVSIRGKGNSLRQFTVVRAMEAAAHEKYQRKLEGVEGELAAVQAKIMQLEAQTPEDNTFTASPEVTKAIADYQQQAGALQAELRQIRLALRQGVDALENRLLAINLLTGPLLVCGFGLWFARRRKR